MTMPTCADVYRLLSPYFEVEAVSDGREALDRALNNPPDLILSDIMMPGLDGFALLKALRTEPSTSTLPVILLSARAGEESRVEGIEAGADDYLVKPFTARELLARVTTHLAMSRLRRQAAERERELRQEAEAARERATSAPKRCAAPTPIWNSSLFRPATICRSRCAWWPPSASCSR